MVWVELHSADMQQTGQMKTGTTNFDVGDYVDVRAYHLHGPTDNSVECELIHRGSVFNECTSGWSLRSLVPQPVVIYVAMPR